MPDHLESPQTFAVSPQLAQVAELPIPIEPPTPLEQATPFLILAVAATALVFGPGLIAAALFGEAKGAVGG